MKKKWIGFRIIISMCAVLGWWGLLYPELSLTPDTVSVSVEDNRGNLRELPAKQAFDSGLYRDLLHAGKDKITFRSRLLTNLSLFLEAMHGRDGKQ